MSLNNKYQDWKDGYPIILKDHKKSGQREIMSFEQIERVLNKLPNRIFKNGYFIVSPNIESAIVLKFKKGVKGSRILLLSDEKKYSKTVAKKLGIRYAYKEGDIIKMDKKDKAFVQKHEFNSIQNCQYEEPIPGKDQTKKVWMSRHQFGLEEITGKGKYCITWEPTSWAESNNAVLKKHRNQKTIKNDLKYFEVGAEKEFPGKPGISIGITIVKKDSTYQGQTKFIENGNQTIIDIRNGLPKTVNEQFRLDLVDKILNSSQKKYQFLFNDKSKNTGYNNVLKLIVNFSKAYFTLKDQDHNMPITKDAISELQVCLLLKNEKQGKMEKSFLHSKAMVWVANNYKKRGQTGFCDAVKRSVFPYFQTKIWTDKDVYKVLNLTQQEIDRIESDTKTN